MESGVIKKLESLVHLDIDAFHAYAHAIRHVEADLVRQQLKRFQNEHEQHVLHLSEEIARMGAVPPAFSLDFKGFLIEGFTALWSVTGQEGALRAMRATEKMISRVYDESMHAGLLRMLSPSVRAMLHDHDRDELRHLQYLDHVLDTRLWQPLHVEGVRPLTAD